MRVSIVTTLYMSESYVLDFHRRARAAADKITGDVEMIFVDDGSPDGSLDQAVSLLGEDPCVRVIQLSRNFGHHKAMMTGLAHATGDLVFLIDSDLEEDPALLGAFYEELVSTGSDVVFGVSSSLVVTANPLSAPISLSTACDVGMTSWR